MPKSIGEVLCEGVTGFWKILVKEIWCMHELLSKTGTCVVLLRLDNLI